MPDDQVIAATLGRIVNLLEELAILQAVRAGANRRRLARLLAAQNARISKVSRLFKKEKAASGNR